MLPLAAARAQLSDSAPRPPSSPAAATDFDGHDFAGHRLTSPVLLCHGDRDTNVPVGESVQAHQELQARGAASELFLIPGEGHTIVGRDHLVELSERVAAWFDRWL